MQNLRQFRRGQPLPLHRVLTTTGNQAISQIRSGVYEIAVAVDRTDENWVVIERDGRKFYDSSRSQRDTTRRCIREDIGLSVSPMLCWKWAVYRDQALGIDGQAGCEARDHGRV